MAKKLRIFLTKKSRFFWTKNLFFFEKNARFFSLMTEKGLFRFVKRHVSVGLRERSSRDGDKCCSCKRTLCVSVYGGRGHFLAETPLVGHRRLVGQSATGAGSERWDLLVVLI